MKAAGAHGLLGTAYQVLISEIKLDQVPDDVRRCIELVRTCHHDLEDPIKVRNESLPIIEFKPTILERVNTITDNTHRDLLEVARLVEKPRPEARDGSSPLGRPEWLFIGQYGFTNHEPLVARQHASVITELNFLRQLVLLAPSIRPGPACTADGGEGNEGGKKSIVAWDNVALLDEMLGGNKAYTVSALGLI
ncbi:hypothetical protein OQA88_12477 [Cercophora sp. LCS_1]